MNKYNKINFKYPEKKNLVSFIIPVYKDYAGLLVTIRSIKNQINLENYKIEIIVANDGKNKKIYKICQEHQVKMIEIEQNAGSYFARNKAIEYSSGEYLSFIDANIFVPQNWTKEALKKIKKEYYLAGNIKIFKKNSNTLSYKYEKKNAFPIKLYIKKYNFGVSGNLLIKRTLIEKIGGFDERFRSGGDNEFGNRVYNANYELIYLDSPAFMHPPRNFYSIIKKIKRVSKGRKLLSTIYPEKFNKNSFIKKLINLKNRITGVKDYNSNHKNNGSQRKKFSLKMFLFLCLLETIRMYYQLILIFYKPKINPKLKIRKITYFDFKKS